MYTCRLGLQGKALAERERDGDTELKYFKNFGRAQKNQSAQSPEYALKSEKVELSCVYFFGNRVTRRCTP